MDRIKKVRVATLSIQSVVVLASTWIEAEGNCELHDVNSTL